MESDKVENYRMARIFNSVCNSRTQRPKQCRTIIHRTIQEAVSVIGIGVPLVTCTFAKEPLLLNYEDPKPYVR